MWSPYGWLSALRTPATASGGYVLFSNSGVYDFAGDGPVHMVGGFASIAAAWILRPRIGRFDSTGQPVDMPGHNASLTLLGVFLLWFGWYGFNPGSTNAIVRPKPGFSAMASAIAVNTTIAAAAGCLSTMLTCMLHTYASMRVVVWDLIIAGNGALAGLVAITGGCAFMETWAALVTGLIAGPVYYGASKLVLYKFSVRVWGCEGWRGLAAAGSTRTLLIRQRMGMHARRTITLDAWQLKSVGPQTDWEATSKGLLEGTGSLKDAAPLHGRYTMLRLRTSPPKFRHHSQRCITPRLCRSARQSAAGPLPKS